MPDSAKITVLLADEDSLRRDGLASVLRANPEIEIVAGCPDGQTALDAIRDLRPDVAIIDLNLPKLHGIELVRRIRGEFLGTKTIILSGTIDDEIVREVVRSGADAYLLKNGPARHLTDAINYIRDGGQYFSPQLHRDGLDRHLREEAPRVQESRELRLPEPELRESDYGGGGIEERMYRGADGVWYNERRDPERPRPKRHPMRRTSDPEHFRERIREETSRELRDRDYDIMTQMADGIRPILDRLDEIEYRVVEMEEGEEPLPANPRGWLSDQLADSLGSSSYGGSSYGAPAKGGLGRIGGGGRSMDLESRLPELIEEAVSRRFQSMAGQLQDQIEEHHVRTLESFVKNIQVKLVQRVSALEQNMTQQTEAMMQLRAYNQRTEDNLTRLISGVDKLATELPKRLAAANSDPMAIEDGRDAITRNAPTFAAAGKPKRGAPSPTKRMIPKLIWSAAGLIALVSGGLWLHQHSAGSVSAETTTVAEKGSAATASSAPAPAEITLEAPPASADTKTKLDAARQFMEKKEYAKAEGIFNQVRQAEPKNVDAIKGLASVLYREDKIEESAAMLDQLPKN